MQQLQTILQCVNSAFQAQMEKAIYLDLPPSGAVRVPWKRLNEKRTYYIQHEKNPSLIQR